MPPAQNPQILDTRHLLPEHKQKGTVGPLIGALIIIVLLGFGALYFYGAYLNRQHTPQQLPFIPEDNSTQQAG